MKCPICKEMVNELDDVCPNCKTNFDEYESYKIKTTDKRSYADCLNFMANANIVLSIIGAICIWLNFSTIEVVKNFNYISGTYTDTVINWYGIIGGIAVLIAGITIFFLLKTVVDIYWEVEK